MSVEHLLQHCYADTKLSILDLGCGNGALVTQLSQQGHDAFGCDFVDFDASDFSPDTTTNGFLRAIELHPYRLPFDDNQFDCVVSSQVLEHVMDYESTFREIYRVLKPGGLSLHDFPSRYRLIEPHVFVPLATLVRNKVWLHLWALLGIRNQFQNGKTALEVAQLNFRYLHAHTNYLTKSKIREHGRIFSEVSFREDIFFFTDKTTLKRQSLKKRIFVLFGGDWLRARLSGTFFNRVLYLRK